MIGIVDYESYLPRCRLRRDLIAEQWGTRSLGGVKAVSNFDQDALTLGYEAAWPLVQRRPGIDGLYFASTTAPYWQRASSSFIAAACDLPEDVTTVDFGGSLRSGSNALSAALSAVSAGAINRVLVTASDVRHARPESIEEQLFGDAAAAVVIGCENVIAEVVAQTSRSDSFLDEWRRDCDQYVMASRSRFSTQRGYEENVLAVGRRILEQTNHSPERIARVALSSPDGRAHLTAAKKLGFDADQLVEVPVKDVGITGAAMPLELLCAAVDSAKPDDLVLVISHGDGADAMLFQVTEERNQRVSLATGGDAIEFPSYSIFRKLCGFTQQASAEGAIVSNVTLEKEERQNLRLHGTRCPKCRTVQFPLAGVCVKCRNREVLEEVPLARRGTVFTFTRDYLYPAPQSPTVMTVIELEDRARFYCQMTDVNPEDIKLGQPVELTLRRMTEGGGMHHYYWKCRPMGWGENW